MALVTEMLASIEENLITQVDRMSSLPFLAGLQAMIRYHMGWEGQGAGTDARGKRIRPLLVTLCAAASGGNWQDSLPLASAVELVHNFSLLHDDIEDNSPLRRGRPTVWKLWGVPQAINTGDAIFTLAHLASLDVSESIASQNSRQICYVLVKTCLELTQGQYLDISFEDESEIDIEAYWQMIGAKTAALISCCCELGALAGQAPQEVRQSYTQFGRYLGLAFQALDDILGIWGDEALTGKSAASDLVTGKKTLPVLYGLSRKGEFFTRWKNGLVNPEEIPSAIHILTEEGARAYAQHHADHLTNLALEYLAQAKPMGEAGKELENLALTLLQRKN